MFSENNLKNQELAEDTTVCSVSSQCAVKHKHWKCAPQEQCKRGLHAWVNLGPWYNSCGDREEPEIPLCAQHP